MTRHRRMGVLLISVLLLTAAGGWAVYRTGGHPAPRDRGQGPGARVIAGTVSLAPSPSGRRIVFRSTAWGPHRDELASAPADQPNTARTVSGVKCLRLYAAAGTGICLRGDFNSAKPTYAAIVLDAGLNELRRFPLAGVPTRARVSPSGHLIAWTVFTGGDSYAVAEFSTRTSILDTRDWKLQDNLEDYAVIKDGQPYHPADHDIWGVSFADDQHFYATMAADGQHYLVHGDISARTLTTVHTNVECPSLSPDGTRIAYKKRVPGRPAAAPWQLHVLDLRTMTETPLAETRNVDDQVVWVDANTVAYALPSDYLADLWTVPADGSGAPHRVVKSAVSPAFIG